MAPYDPNALTPLASYTLERIKNALEQGLTHASYEEVRMLKMILAKTRRIAPHELAEFLGPNQTLIARVVASVQEMGLTPIQNITHALHTVGYTKVRDVFTSIMLLDCAEQKIGEIEQQKAASICLASGFIARSITKRISKIDPEISFICASLRGLGKLVLTTLLMPDYRRTRMLFSSMQPNSAFEKIFGITPEDLSLQMALYSQLPDEIIESFPCDTPASSETNRDLRELSQLAYDLTILLEASTLSTEEFIAQSIIRTREDRLASILSKDDIWYIFGDVQEQIQSLHGGDGLAVVRNPLLVKVDAIVLGESLHSGVSSEIYSQVDAPEREQISEAALEFAQLNATVRPKRQVKLREFKGKPVIPSQDSPDKPFSQPHAEPKNIPTEPVSRSMGKQISDEDGGVQLKGMESRKSLEKIEITSNLSSIPSKTPPPAAPSDLDDGSQEIEEISQMLKSPPIDTQKLLRLATRALQLRLTLNQTVTFVESKNGWFHAHSGSGRLFQQIKGQDIFHQDDPTIFKEALDKGSTLVIEKPDPEKFKEKIPDWLIPHIPNTTLTLLPLKLSADRWMITLGIKYSSSLMTPDQEKLIQTLRENLSASSDPTS